MLSLDVPNRLLECDPPSGKFVILPEVIITSQYQSR